MNTDGALSHAISCSLYPTVVTHFMRINLWIIRGFQGYLTMNLMDWVGVI